MGYRSDVAYTIRFPVPNDADHEERKKVTDFFYTFIAEAKANEETARCFSEEDSDVFKVLEDRLEIRFFAESVKWYEGYSDVDRHEALVSLSKAWTNDNEYIGGSFARIGEDANDIVEEVWGQGDWDWISINRSICVDWE